jgi:hypothetical protein
VIGGASYEGASHAPWQKSKPASAAPEASVIAAVPPDAVVPATREHMPVAATASQHKVGHGREGAPGQLKSAKHQKGHAFGRGHQKTRYAGDASVAARHVKAGHQPHRSHPAAPPTSHRAAKHKSKKPKRQLPGPFDTKAQGHP